MSDPEMFIVGGRRPGRPLRSDVRASERVIIRITPSEREELKRVASDSKQSVAAVVRDAVNSFVQDYSDKIVFLPSGDSFRKRD